MLKFFLLTIAIAFMTGSSAQVDELNVRKGEKGLYLEHKVVAKEGLYSIGRLYNVNPRFIAAYNKMDMNQGIDVDQVLSIPLTDTNFSQKTTSGTPVYYEVASGDGLLKISNDNNNVTLKNLRDWNGLPNDNVQAGSKLIVGFLISKEMVAMLANNRVKKMEAAKKLEEKPLVQAEPAIVAKTEVPEVKKEQKQESQVVTAVVKQEVKAPAISENGYFKTSFDLQARNKPVSKDATLTSGIFKTTSGWQDAKYYLLIDGVSPGTIVKVINPDNNKAVYAKVLGEMNGIRQNQGLDIRISNAAASALKITEEDKFVVKVNY